MYKIYRLTISTWLSTVLSTDNCGVSLNSGQHFMALIKFEASIIYLMLHSMSMRQWIHFTFCRIHTIATTEDPTSRKYNGFKRGKFNDVYLKV